MSDRCCFTLHISGTNIESGVLSKELKLAATVEQNAGEPVLDADGDLIRIREFTHWAYRIEGMPGIGQTDALRDFLRELDKNRLYLQFLNDRGASIRIYYVILTSNPTSGEYFDTEIIQLLADLQIALDIEVFKQSP